MHDLGYKQANDIGVSKVLCMTVDEATDETVSDIVTALNEKLFTSTAIEKYSYKIVDEKENA